jgi:peptide chain release factor subunit 3
VTISLNIGGSKATPPPQGKPPAKAEVQSAPAKEATAPASASKAFSKSGTSTPRQPNSGTETPTKGASKSKGTVFTMDRAKNDADMIVKDQTGAADEDTIKELYGELEEGVVDTNSAFPFVFCLLVSLFIRIYNNQSSYTSTSYSPVM